MSKKRILMVNEFSPMNTGYSTYGNEVLSRLYKSGKYEIGELACYCVPNDPQHQAMLANIPWKVYPNVPSQNSPLAQAYNNNSTHAFGEFSYENVLLDFKPDIVFDIRDYWMMEFEERHPFRRFYNWVIMPTVDAEPQQKQWVTTYCRADAVLTYQDWSGKLLVNQSGGRVNWQGSASPSASDSFKPLPNRKEFKSLLGFGPNVKIIGTVMRNQRRKLYPELFATFRKYLDVTKSKDTFLYCHVSFPDNGWDIPSLIKENGLSSKVILTYVCGRCSFAFPTVFQDAVTFCPKCGTAAAHMANVKDGVNQETFVQIFNMFDIYVQYANSEGFGMPQVEAAACGVPVAATDYSAMSDIVRKLKGYPIRLAALVREFETDCNRARPDDNHLLEILIDFFDKPEAIRELKRQETRRMFEENYNWDATAAAWMRVFDALPTKESWNSPAKLYTPAQPSQELAKLNNVEYARWLIANVLGEPEKIGTYFESRLIRDLNYGVYLAGMGGLYYNELSHMFHKPQYQNFTREIAFNEMVQICQLRNQSEQRRIGSFAGTMS